jgi:hypothetical protein
VEPGRDAGQLAPHLAQQLAGVPRLDLGQRVGIARDDVAEPPDEPGAAESGELAPWSRQRPPGRGDGKVDVTGVPVCRGGPGGLQKRVGGRIAAT